jgi:glycerol-3-phosphate dehydrogenase
VAQVEQLDRLEQREQREREGYDVLIVGAGVVGCAIAHELARRPGLRICLLDAADDVGAGTSKANTAILHTGFDAAPGSIESRLVARGYELLGEFAADCGIAVERTGALLVAWDDEQLAALPKLAAKAEANGYRLTRPVGVRELYAREAQLGPGALGALEVPGESIIDPWTPSHAFAGQAVRAGVDLRLRTRVTAIRPGPGGRHEVITQPGSAGSASSARLLATHVVNAAGLYSDEIDRMLGFSQFTVTPRRGQLIVFDKQARSLVGHILLPVPSSLGKGVLVAPTVFGNVLLGPTAEDLTDKAATGSTAEGIAFLRGKGERILPALLAEEVTTVYAGLRAATEHADYQLRGHPQARYVCVGGIRSTGLTASMAIAEEVAGLLGEAGLPLRAPRELEPVSMPPLGERAVRPYQDAARVASDPLYGLIVCHCERVTAGELRDARAATVPATSIGGLRRRTRAGLGRCQGFACGSAIRALMEGAGRER